jgi:hypothetical protein
MTYGYRASPVGLARAALARARGCTKLKLGKLAEHR